MLLINLLILEHTIRCSNIPHISLWFFTQLDSKLSIKKLIYSKPELTMDLVMDAELEYALS
jgi:hypothetical protein